MSRGASPTSSLTSLDSTDTEGEGHERVQQPAKKKDKTRKRKSSPAVPKDREVEVKRTRKGNYKVTLPDGTKSTWNPAHKRAGTVADC